MSLLVYAGKQVQKKNSQNFINRQNSLPKPSLFQATQFNLHKYEPVESAIRFGVNHVHTIALFKCARIETTIIEFFRDVSITMPLKENLCVLFILLSKIICSQRPTILISILRKREWAFSNTLIQYLTRINGKKSSEKPYLLYS